MVVIIDIVILYLIHAFHASKPFVERLTRNVRYFYGLELLFRFRIDVRHITFRLGPIKRVTTAILDIPTMKVSPTDHEVTSAILNDNPPAVRTYLSILFLILLVLPEGGVLCHELIVACLLSVDFFHCLLLVTVVHAAARAAPAEPALGVHGDLVAAAMEVERLLAERAEVVLAAGAVAQLALLCVERDDPVGAAGGWAANDAGYALHGVVEDLLGVLVHLVLADDVLAAEVGEVLHVALAHYVRAFEHGALDRSALAQLHLDVLAEAVEAELVPLGALHGEDLGHGVGLEAGAALVLGDVGPLAEHEPQPLHVPGLWVLLDLLLEHALREGGEALPHAVYDV